MDTICPLFILSLSYVFEKESSTKANNTIQKMLQLIERALDTMQKSSQCMEQAIHDFETLRAGSIKLTFSYR